MCPLRIILIFLSATLAGFFVLKGLRSPEIEDPVVSVDDEECLPLSGKVGSAMRLGFWTCVDMASGRYLWRNLVSPASASGKKI